MTQVLYDKFAIPDSCHLGKRVFKKLFYENASLGATDKKALRDDIDTITWVYTLKPTTIPIHAYKDEEREYDEIALLQVDLKTQKRTGRIVEVIHRAIPYPLVLVFVFEDSVALSMAHKRFSQAEKGAIVAEEFFTTEWLDLENLEPIEETFLLSLALPGLPHTDLHVLYGAWIDRVVALKCARRTRTFRLTHTVAESANRRSALTACHELEASIAEEQGALKKETQFNRQVEHNVRIKQMEKELERKVAAL